MKADMRAYTAVADESSLRGEGSWCFNGKRADEGEDALNSLSFEIEQQQGPPVQMEYSIENGLENTNTRRRSPGWKSWGKISIPRRYRVAFCFVTFVAIIFIASISAVAVASKKKSSRGPSAPASKTIQEDNELGSRFDNSGRGDGGGSGNSSMKPQGGLAGSNYDCFIQSQNDNVFLGENVRIPPFSTLDPVNDLSRIGFDRPEASSPGASLDPLVASGKRALPTNAWYQNMLRLDTGQEPTKNHKVYTVPYVIDAAGDFAGIRAHATRIEATPSQVRLAVDDPYGLTLGAMTDFDRDSTITGLDKGYSVHEATDLGLTLQWTSFMETTLVRGSPYVTMIYNMHDPIVSQGMLPTMRWGLDTSESPIVDGSKTIDCRSEPVFTVERDLELVFHNSGQRWMLFFSRPVQLQCQDTPGTPTIFQVMEGETDHDYSALLIIRGALVVSSSNYDEAFRENYANQLRASADLFPGTITSVNHSFNSESDTARISFDWDAQSMRKASNHYGGTSENTNQMIMFALPHHQEVLAGDLSPTLCTTSMMGPSCLVQGNTWDMYETLPVVDFRAARHPNPKYIPVLAEALVQDIRYEMPSNFQSGAADTYFSGKTTAKLARILLIAAEIKELCASASRGQMNAEYADACDRLELPSDEEFDEALNQLRESVTIWVRTNTKAPFVYDKAWGGLVNCGCLYNGGECTNDAPTDCPAFTDQGLNFGNGFYNDHHFHYGYHIYAAAALAHFDPAWGMDYYEDVLLLVRDFANPSEEDTAFPVFRNKDWYRGHSWASGLTKPMFDNIMNQESTSEAIMAYEAVALFGKTMASIFQNAGDTSKASVATMMHKIGRTLTATEIRSTQKYWQVRQNIDEAERIYPASYTASVVGILWETFAQFTTWFGNAPYLIYGIQLLPLTPISEARDGLEWAKEIYGPLSASCDGACVSEGWSVQVYAILATIGRVQEAIEKILKIPLTAYESAGGNGHSKSNTLWYLSTRPSANNPSFNSEKKFRTNEWKGRGRRRRL
mmetsp:Transcript_223/g.544  ORF Transcript_223/g.544 Transcript_223/m.544 type:complete len:1015 (+) Transcript_223:213-3257(+)